MFIMPDEVHNNEEWIVWLLGMEFPGGASPRVLSERMHISPEQTLEHIQKLEVFRALNVLRDAATKREILSVRLTPSGKDKYNQILSRKQE
jgi:DNA-binding MarR family transcriptional regulator